LNVRCADTGILEADRLAALDRYDILDTDREAAFDDIVELASVIFEAPIAVVNLVADGRQWFKAELGIGARELPLDVSICRHAILQRGVFVVPDLAADPRFEDNPLVTAAGGLRFYAGALLETPEGLPLGTVCVLDVKPRPEGVTERQARALKALASQTMAQLEARRSQVQTRESEARLRFLDRLAEATQPLTEADEVMATTARLLGQHLNLSVCAYADMDADEDGFTIRGDWAAPGATTIVGHYRLADFGRLAVENLSAGLPLVINDNLREIAPEEAATFQNIGIAATICMPLVKEGRLTALMAIHDRVPRRWTDQELSLLREVTARSWAHVERVAATAELRASEGRFRAAVDAVQGVLWTNNAAGKMEGEQPAWAELTGQTFDDYRGYGWSAAVHPDDAEPTVTAWNAAVANKQTFSFEHRLRTRDGEWRRFSVRAIPIFDAAGEIREWVGVHTDVTEQRNAEAALHESEKMLRALNVTLERRVAEALAERGLLADIIDGTDIFVQVVDCDYNWLAINASAASEFSRIFGVPRPRAGDNMLEALKARPSDCAAVKQVWSRALGGEEFVEVDEFGDPSIDRRYYEMRFRVLRDADGRALGAYQFVSDVTERLREQNRLKEAEEALRQSQKMEAMGQLTGGVAHDFNNLLAPIIGSLDMLVRRGVGSDRERRLIDGALQSAERAKTLVQRLLAFARRQPLQPVSVEIPPLIEGMVGLISSTLGPTIDVRVDCAPEVPLAKADPNQLEMALLNLAVNARDAMPRGGELTIRAKSERLEQAQASDLPHGEYVRLSVLDTGTGMDEETLRRAIEPFFSTKGVGKGTGLGLSMVHGLAAQLGGGLTIDSSPGKGTAVELWLPISVAPAGEADVASTPPTARTGRGVVLLVDDEPLVRMSTADMLMDLGFEVVEASTAEDALELIKTSTPPDIVVTDHLMPGMSGVELAREARAITPGLPVLLVSGYAEIEGIAPELARLTKPFRNAELAASIAALLLEDPISWGARC
jgi:PAS domain S-box-containing protein